MKNVDDLLDKAKEVTGSDYRTAKDLSIANQLIGNWRGRISMPSNKHVIEICKIANIDLGDAITAVEYSRENERPLKQTGFSNVVFLSSLSATSFGGMSLTKVSDLPYEAIGTLLLTSTMYIMLNSKIKKSTKIEGQLRTLSNQENFKFVAANDVETSQISTHRIY